MREPNKQEDTMAITRRSNFYVCYETFDWKHKSHIPSVYVLYYCNSLELFSNRSLLDVEAQFLDKQSLYLQTRLINKLF